jgi:hypothetical protein
MFGPFQTYSWPSMLQLKIFYFFFFFSKLKRKNVLNQYHHTISNASIMKLSGNTKGGSINVSLTSCLTGLESAVWQLTIFVFICETD